MGRGVAALKILQGPCNLWELFNFQLPVARIFIGIQCKGFEMAQGDKDCTQALFTLDVAGDWELRGKSKAVKGAYNAFFGFKTRTLTAKADGAVQFMNQAGFCGKKDWKVGEAYDIHTTGCAQLGAKPLTECKGEHDLVKLDGAKWFLGDRSGDMCKKSGHPKKLHSVALIKKQ